MRVTIQKDGSSFAISAPTWNVKAPYKETEMQALAHLGVSPLPDPRFEKTEKEKKEQKKEESEEE